MKKYTFVGEKTEKLNEFRIIPKNSKNFLWKELKSYSYDLAPARILGLRYADYLRFLIIMFPDDVVVRMNCDLIPVAYWRKGENYYNFVRLLSYRLALSQVLVAEEGDRRYAEFAERERKKN